MKSEVFPCPEGGVHRCWDVTFLRAQVQGRWFYLFLIFDFWRWDFLPVIKGLTSDREQKCFAE